MEVPPRVTPLRSADRPSTVFGPGRLCVEDGCSTVLSRYNPGDRCAAHAPREPVIEARPSRYKTSAGGSSAAPANDSLAALRAMSVAPLEEAGGVVYRLFEGDEATVERVVAELRHLGLIGRDPPARGAGEHLTPAGIAAAAAGAAAPSAP